MTSVKIGEKLYPASISGKMHDADWGNRQTKSIKMDGGYELVSSLFHDGMSWSIVETYSFEKTDEFGNPILDSDLQPVFEERTEEYDNSDYNILGDITLHPDGTCTVKMGKETDEEKLLVLLYGGE